MIETFKKFRFGLRFAAAFWRKHKPLIAVGLVGGVVVFFFLPRLPSILFSQKTERVGLVGKSTINELPLEVQQLLSKGLTTILPSGEATPSLAASWQISEDQKEYFFTLKDNLYWATDKPILAEEINYHFSDAAMSVIDQKTIKFELKQPFTPFPTVLARPVFKEGLVGCGEYEVKSIKKNGRIVESLLLKPEKESLKPNLVIRFYPTEKAAKTGFKLGEVDVLKEIKNPGELENWEEIKVAATVKQNQFVAIIFNTQNEKLGDKSVRQALAYAVRKQWKPRAFNSYNPNSWAYNANVKPYNFDLEKAQELLEKTKEENRVSFEEIELTSTPSLLPIAEEIKKDWEKLGLHVKIKVISSLDEPFEALLITQEIPPDPDQYTLWHSKKASLSRYESPRLDKLLEDGRKTLDKKERQEIYQDFQRFLVEDTPAIFLFHPTVYTISRE